MGMKLCKAWLFLGQKVGESYQDGTGQGYVLENAFTQRALPWHQLVQMEEDFRALPVQLERFPPRDILVHEDAVSRTWIQNDLDNLRDALLQCVDQQAPWTMWGGSQVERIHEGGRLYGHGACNKGIRDHAAFSFEQGGVNCWRVSESLSGTHEKLLQRDHPQCVPGALSYMRCLRSIPTSPSLTATCQRTPYISTSLCRRRS
eukprot:1574355-Amphidinium_carterae.1